MKRFETGKEYQTRSACDHDCIFKIFVHRRTEKSVWVTGLGIKTPARRAIEIYDGMETFYPFGRYSMAPVIRAN